VVTCVVDNASKYIPLLPPVTVFPFRTMFDPVNKEPKIPTTAVVVPVEAGTLTILFTRLSCDAVFTISMARPFVVLIAVMVIFLYVM
jgi:hypothetical protein